MNIRLLFSESLRSLAANLSTTAAATVTVLISMFLLGLIIALKTWSDSWNHHVKKGIAVHVYFCTELKCGHDATSEEETAVARLIGTFPEVRNINFISKEQAFEQERKKHPDITKNLPGNPLPDALEVLPKNGDQVFTIADKLQPLPPGVEDVNTGGKKTKHILRVLNGIQIVFILAVLVLVAAATLLISNTIRLSIFARRREIEVMKLVGATNWFVRGPFMLEGLLCGLAGAFLAVILLLLGKEVALPAIIGHVEGGSDVQAWPFWAQAFIVTGAGLVLGAAGSGLTLRRFLRV